MNRRSFLKSVVAVAAAGVLPVLSLETPSTRNRYWFNIGPIPRETTAPKYIVMSCDSAGTLERVYWGSGEQIFPVTEGS